MKCWPDSNEVFEKFERIQSKKDVIGPNLPKRFVILLAIYYLLVLCENIFFEIILILKIAKILFYMSKGEVNTMSKYNSKF